MLESEGALAEGDTLGEFAHGTGGVWFHNNNDLVDGLNRVAAAPEWYYVLGFSPQSLTLDGSFHSLKVSVNAKSVTSQSRHGYFAAKAGVSKEDQAKADILKDETLAAGKADSIETNLTFDAPPGKYTLRLVVRDSEGEMIGARNSAVEIP
jgi:hypothetical protein